MVASLLLPFLLVGCADPPPDVVATVPEADTGSAVPTFLAEDPEPDLTLEALTTMILQPFGRGTPNGRALRDTYLAMMAMGDADCPGSTTNITQDFVLGCTAASGYYYSGVCMYGVIEAQDGAGNRTSIWGLGGDFELADPDGAYFAAGGGVTWEGRTAPDGSQTFTSNIRGTWQDEAQANWLGDGLSCLVDIYGGQTAAGAHYVTVDGGIAVGDVDLYFDALTWDWSGACAGAPTGELRFRDTRGYWYAWNLGDDCDPCGEVVFHDAVSLGELCLDLTPIGEDIYYNNAPEP